jgi:hypothetical protein
LRRRKLIGVTVLLVGVAIATFAVLSWPRDGSPDDRLLAAMQNVARKAQIALDETGESPSSLEELLSARGIDTEVPRLGLSYDRLGDSSIRLCGEFERRSSGQATARPFNDVTVGLQPELAGPRPRAGHHCYDIALQSTDPALRADALFFRDMNAVATAAECAFSATGSLPATISDAATLGQRQRDDPACGAQAPAERAGGDLEYVPIGPESIRLCAPFHRGYDASDRPARVFDPVRDARFDTLTQPRPEAGRRCYTIRMLLPDPLQDSPVSIWDEPLDEGSLPAAMRGAAAHDKRAIGDVVNVLGLARCALTMSDRVPRTIEDALRVTALRPRIAERYGCDWARSYFAQRSNSPVATYQPINDERVRVCARFLAAWRQPLALDFYGEALEEWPTSLPELQQPISRAGRRCFDVRLTAIGSGVL